jgi:hypothetical protein
MSERSGVRTAGLIAGLIVGIAVILLSVLVAGMRWKVPPVLTAVRRMNRTVTNPRVMRTAGSATIVSQGASVDVDAPIIAATSEVDGQIPARTLRTLRLFGVTECLSLRRAADGLD